jgi:hypothetical protein
MKTSPQTAYQQLRHHFHNLRRFERTVSERSDSLSILLKESPDHSAFESFQLEFAKPPSSLPYEVLHTIQTWLPHEIPLIESLVDDLTEHGHAAPMTHKSQHFTEWDVTVSVFLKTVAVQFDRVPPTTTVNPATTAIRV